MTHDVFAFQLVWRVAQCTFTAQTISTEPVLSAAEQAVSFHSLAKSFIAHKK